MSQKDLTNQTGMIQQSISFLELGSRDVTLTNLIKYLLGLGIDINNLFK